jgi:hypothetical protein
MTVVSRRLVPFAAVLAVAVTLAVWITASAAGPWSPSPLPTMHFTGVTTSQHMSLNGATNKNPVGVSLQVTKKLVARGAVIGHAFGACTIVNSAGSALCNVEARFRHRGRLELQGLISGQTNTFAITGGTGAFATARGWWTGHKGHATLTFR